MKDRMPKHINCTLREWKHMKRQQLNITLKALSELRSGIFYTSDRGEFQTAYKALEELKNKMSVKNWKGCRNESP